MDDAAAPRSTSIDSTSSGLRSARRLTGSSCCSPKPRFEELRVTVNNPEGREASL